MTITVAVGIPKGGTGKTTTSVLLAEAWAALGHETVLLDTDPQVSASAARWHALAGDQMQATLDILAKGDIGQRITRGVARTADRIVIDTAPNKTRYIDACKASDIALIPVTPTVMDLMEVANAADLATQHNAQPLVVINRARSDRRKDIDEAREHITDQGYTVLDTAIPDRALIAHRIGLAPTPTLTDLYTQLAHEIEKRQQ